MSPSSPQTTVPGDAGRLFREGNVTDALAAATAAVRKAPTDIGARVLMAELLAFSGNIERADVVLDAAADLDPSTAVVVAEFRQLLRGELARRQLFSDGRVPEFLGEPSAAQQLALAAIVALRNGDAAEAGKLASQAEEQRVHPAMPTTCWAPASR
jgi:type VI secretion system protein ImpE